MFIHFGNQTHGRPCRHIQSTLITGNGLSPLPRHMWWRFRKVAAFERLCVFGGLCVDMWRLVHQWSFFAVWLSFDCFWRLVHCWYSFGRMSIGTPMVIFAVLTVFWLFLTVFDEWYIVLIVKNTQNYWCTNRHRSTKTVPTVYQQCTNRQKQSKTVKRQSKQQKWGVKVKGLRLRG